MPDDAPSAARCAAPPPVFEGDPEMVRPASAFPWLDFHNGSGEYAVEDTSGPAPWKYISSTSKGKVVVGVWSRRVEEHGGLCEFLLRGTLPIPRDIYFVLCTDMEHRSTWDSTTMSVRELSSSGPGPEAGILAERERVLHWEAKYPWPLGKREYVLAQTVHTETDADNRIIRCIQCRALPAASSSALQPSRAGVTRIDDYRSHMVISAGLDEQQARFALLYFEDSKVNLPGWLMTQAAAQTIPSQMASAVAVGERYPPARVLLTLGRYGIKASSQTNIACGLASGGVGSSPANSNACEHEPDGEAFYSASDDEFPKTTSSKGVIVGRASSGNTDVVGLPSSSVAPVLKRGRGTTAAAKTNKKHMGQPGLLRLSLAPKNGQVKLDSECEDIEEGIMIIGKEERELLLELLAERREKHSARWWTWCFRACRYRCCRRQRRHKL